MRSTVTVCMLALAVAATAVAQDWSEGFEAGLASAKSYYEPPNEATVEIGTDNPAEGAQYARATIPGERALEGLSMRATGLAGGRVATVTAQVRGAGDIWLCLISGNGWLYAPNTLALTDEWQEVSLSKTLVATDTTLGIHFLSKTTQQDAVFEMDDIQIALADPPQVYDAEVGPWRFEAEDFALRDAYVAEVAETSGGHVTRHERYMALVDFPFPRTSNPVTIYLRVQPVSVKETYQLETHQNGSTERLVSITPTEIGTWQWMSFPPVTAGEIGDSFWVSLQGDKESAGQVAFDQIALSTRGDMTDEELDAAPAWGARRPLAVVSRAAAPPTLDGLGDDPCWLNTVACAGFVGLRSLPPAQADTSVRICYDDTHLYLLFECQEPILSVAGQRRGEFVANVTERDAEVHQDDSVIALLDPADTGAQVFDFTINALGTIADARAPGPDLWGTRDLGWDSGAEAEGMIGEDAWIVEMSIPLADLGGAPSPGDTWQVGLGRIAKERKEHAAWHPARNGFHDPYEFGTLVFGGATPGVAITTPAALQPGKNEVAASLAPVPGQPSGVYLLSATGPAAKRERTRASRFVALDDGPVDVSAPFTVGQEGELTVEHAAVDAATLEPLYLRPTLTRAVRSSVAEVKIACGGPYELHLNDDVIARGDQATGEPISAPLQRGANVFALRLEQGTAAISVDAPGLRFTGESWKMAPADTESATSAGLDDGSWPVAETSGDDPQLGPVVGEAGKPVVLRRTLLWEKTRVWPTPEPAFHLARGATQHISFITDGLAGKKLDGWTTFIATPPEFEIVGSTGFYGTTNDEQPEFQLSPEGTRQVDGREMRVVKVVADKLLLSGRHFIMSMFEAHVRYREGAGDPDPDAEFIYWSEANGGNISEAPQRFNVRVLPELAGRHPETLVFQLWGGWFTNIDDLTVREGILECAQAAGFNDIVAGDRWTTDHSPPRGLGQTLTTNFKPWGMNLSDHLEAEPEQRLITGDGEPLDDRMCMSFLLGEGWPAVETALKARIDEVRPQVVDIDYEYGPYAGPHSCYCPLCLAAFRERDGVPADATLDAESIKQEHAAEWIDFMARRVAEMFAKFKETVHRLAPGTEFTIYSGYQTPSNAEMYGIDWQYIGDLQSCDRAGCGYGDGEPVIAKTVEALQGIPLVCGLLSVPYDTTITTPLTPVTKARSLRMLLAGTGGILVYDRKSFDGRVWHAIGEVTRLAAEHEDVFLNGKPAAALEGFDITQGQVLSAGQTTLVCVMNQGSRVVEHQIQLPVDAGAGVEFYSGQAVGAGEQVSCELQPGDAAVYVLKR